jgi:hypothetical protein
VEYEAKRHIDLPALHVIEVATAVENLFWMKGMDDGTILSGDGKSPGSRFRTREADSEEFVFEVVHADELRFEFRGTAAVGLLEAAIRVEPHGNVACEVTVREHIRPQHFVERLMVALGGPIARKACVREAEDELERMEDVIRWVDGGRRGAPFAARAQRMIDEIRRKS